MIELPIKIPTRLYSTKEEQRVTAFSTIHGDESTVILPEGSWVRAEECDGGLRIIIEPPASKKPCHWCGAVEDHCETCDGTGWIPSSEAPE
tara:strand:+ start:125 stop:397 length:273 start_codon:yes stop_codon:yes gene_type:complete